MLTSSQRPLLRAHPRQTLAWLVLLSLSLHVGVVAGLLLVAPARRLTEAPEPLSMELIAGGEPAQVAREPAALAAPVPAEITPAAAAPVPDIPSSPPVQPPEPVMPAPAPTPVTAPATVPSPLPAPAAMPAPVAPPVPEVPPAQLAQPAELPLPAPPQPPAAVHAAPAAPAPPRRPAARPTHPRAAAETRNNAPASEPSSAAEAPSAASRTIAASNGAAWMGRLKQWWDQHSFYPREASQTNEGGNVRVRIAIAPDGQVTSIQVMQGSGSSVLDAAALAVFRGARLPPLPPGTLAQPADVVVTLHYNPAG